MLSTTSSSVIDDSPLRAAFKRKPLASWVEVIRALRSHARRSRVSSSCKGNSGAFSIVGAKFTKMRNRPTVMKSYMIDMGTILISGGKAEISNQQALQAQK